MIYGVLIEAGLVGESGGLIGLLVKRSLGGDIIVEVRFGRANRSRGCTWWNA